MKNYRKDGTEITPLDGDHVYSKYMEGFYSENPDPWGNRGMYIKWFQGLSDLIPENSVSNRKLGIIDIGCGGGNVLEGLVHEFFHLTKQVKITGVDISWSTIDYLNNDDRFKDLKDQPFICKDICDDDFRLPVIQNQEVLIYSIVDVFYYIRDYDWHIVADRIMSQAPLNSYIIVADNFLRPQYRYYYRDKHKPSSWIPYKVEIIGTGKSKDPVIQYTTESGRIVTKYLSWFIYQKVGA